MAKVTPALPVQVLQLWACTLADRRRFALRAEDLAFGLERVLTVMAVFAAARFVELVGFAFGSIQIDGTSREYDVVIDRPPR